jgi:hypothetical protein
VIRVPPLFLALVVASCTRSHPSPTIPASPPLVHPSGLTVVVPRGDYGAHPTATGFRIEPAAAAHQRSPWSVDLRLAADPLAGKTVETRNLDGRETRYHVEIDDTAGSGGPLHTLTATASCGSRTIVLTATQQAEPPARPDWSPAWSILAGTSCTPRD